ncbi:hypothetical protein H7X46_19030 [Pseudonocardia sp. C8]|uniref:hypothetical protein n=1 Tax=Pseudonocardia sp. C8 TaxID=2762759 RepID=UPI001642732A|nr:hypothetical protein [Pseudonocardia sp. C8]MBC3193157.1 hypothetical protein [Pseudonocardia sp. C8]
MDERYGSGPPGVVRVDPDALARAADRFADLAGALGADAAAVPAGVPDAGFASGPAAAALDADLVAGIRARARRAVAIGDGLRAAATAWRTADDAAAASMAASPVDR